MNKQHIVDIGSKFRENSLPILCEDESFFVIHADVIDRAGLLYIPPSQYDLVLRIFLKYKIINRNS